MGQDGRSGRRGRRARPRAGPPRPFCHQRTGRRLPAAVPRRSRSPATVEAAAVLEVPDPRSPIGHTSVTVLDVPADGYRLRLVDLPAAFDREGFYGDAGGDYADNAWRFGMFCRAALEALRADARPLDVLHLHDWHTGPAAIFRDARYADDPIVGRAAILVTLHNLAYHGWTPRPSLPQLGLATGRRRRAIGRRRDRPPALRDRTRRARQHRFAGVRRRSADARLRHGSRRCAPRDGRPVLRHPQRPGYDRLGPGHRCRPGRVVLARPTSAARRRAARTCCRGSGSMPVDPGPVIGMIGRLDPQKGFDLLSDAAPTLLERGVRLVVQGSGHAALAGPFRALAAANPERVFLLERFDREMARRIYAGVDLFAMPSRFEPCGQGQMIALRYGTPPIVHHTGGLADTVIDETTHPGRRDGLLVRWRDGRGAARSMRCGDDAVHGRRAAVARAPGPRHGGRLRLDDRVGAALSRCVPAGHRDPGGPAGQRKGA